MRLKQGSLFYKILNISNRKSNNTTINYIFPCGCLSVLSQFLILYLVLSVCEEVGVASLTGWLFGCHHTQYETGNHCTFDQQYTEALSLCTMAQQQHFAPSPVHKQDFASSAAWRGFGNAPMIQWQPVTQSNPPHLLSPVNWVSVRLQGRDRLTGSVSHSVRQM